ncbi:hypothetical protein FGB62_100g315 [Gracilaria domingensis]|nr:hypothetical protein FGB62_100g315 [Gracilaria domingensis]
MGHELEALAVKYPVVPLLEKSLANRLELLRLNAEDHMGMRDLVPYTLLRMGRDSQCVAFIAHWLRCLNNRLDPLAQHETSNRGDWLYGEADPFDDVFPQAHARRVYAPIPILVALCIVKLRLIAYNQHDERVGEQERLVEVYLDEVHRRCESLLPALINPTPLSECQPPVLKKLGGPSETYFTLLSGYELFVTVPGAVDRLIRRFGPNPQYDCEMHMW